MVRVWTSGDQLPVAAGQGSGAGAVLWVVLLAFAFVAAIVFSCAEGAKAKGSAARKRTSWGGYAAGSGAGGGTGCGAVGGAGCGGGGGAGCGGGGGAGCGGGGGAGSGC